MPPQNIVSTNAVWGYSQNDFVVWGQGVSTPACTTACISFWGWQELRFKVSCQAGASFGVCGRLADV